LGRKFILRYCGRPHFCSDRRRDIMSPGSSWLAGWQHRHIVAFENAKAFPPRFLAPFFEFRFGL
jgi:hypothetical protein